MQVQKIKNKIRFCKWLLGFGRYLVADNILTGEKSAYAFIDETDDNKKAKEDFIDDLDLFLKTNNKQKLKKEYAMPKM